MMFQKPEINPIGTYSLYHVVAPPGCTLMGHNKINCAMKTLLSRVTFTSDSKSTNSLRFFEGIEERIILAVINPEISSMS